MNHSVTDMNIIVKSESHQISQIQVPKAGTGLEDKRLHEFIRQNSIFKHNIVKAQSFMLSMTSLSISSDDGIEKKRIVEMGIGAWCKQKGRGIVNGLEVGGRGRELGEDQ